MVFPLWFISPWLRRDALFWQYWFWQVWFWAVLSNAAADGKRLRVMDALSAKKAAL
jgi:hypothetical protein